MSVFNVPGGGFVLGTNRDESPKRLPARPPMVHEAGGRAWLMPQDADAGGSWVVADSRGRCLCILNGDQPAAPVPTDAPSRGLLLLELAQLSSGEAMLGDLVRRFVEQRLKERAFKLLIVEAGLDHHPNRVDLLEWDGLHEPTCRELQPPCVLVSNSFDPTGVARRRTRWFQPLARESIDLGTDALLAAQSRWHASHDGDDPGGDASSVCMHRSEASTVSFTSVTVDAHQVAMTYRPGAPCSASASERLVLKRAAPLN